MIDIAVIRQKILLHGTCTLPPAEKNSDENGLQPETCPVAQPAVETGPSLTEQIKVARSLIPGSGKYAVVIEAIVENLEKLQMLAEVSEEMKGKYERSNHHDKRDRP
jgi:hypothetical protein